MATVITTPTYLLDDEDLLPILALVDDKDEHDIKATVIKLAQAAFEDGMGVNQPAPIAERIEQALPTISKEVKAMPHYRTWDEIAEDGTRNPIEVFILQDSPADDGVTNVEGWNARLHAALKFVAQH